MLLLMVALMTIFAATMVTSIKFDIKRDREEEMIHRGVQYSRAIRAYYKKLGRYPMTLEDLETANKMRFLRKRYKDPITGQDFRLLHFGEVKLALSGGFGGGYDPRSEHAGKQRAVEQRCDSETAPDKITSGPGTIRRLVLTLDKRERIHLVRTTGATQPIPGVPEILTSRAMPHPRKLSAGLPSWELPAAARRRPFANITTRENTTSGSSCTIQPWIAADLITTPYQPQLQIFGQGNQTVNQQTGSTGPEKGLGTSAPGAPSSPVMTPNSFGNPNPPATPPDTPPQQQ